MHVYIALGASSRSLDSCSISHKFFDQNVVEQKIEKKHIFFYLNPVSWLLFSSNFVYSTNLANNTATIMVRRRDLQTKRIQTLLYKQNKNLIST